MNTYDIYLKGGKVLTVNSKFKYGQMIQIIFEGDERETLIHFQEPYVTLRKDDISAIHDRTYEREMEINLNGLNKPYKPWREQK